MEADELTQHCFRCKGLVVVNPATLKALPSMLYRAANLIASDNVALAVSEDSPDNILVNDLRAMAVLLDMIPED